MSTFIQSLHHIIFATSRRRHTLVEAHRRELFGYMFGTIKGMDCHLYRLNGMADHVHLLVGLRPDMGPAGFVKTLKLSSGRWIRDSGVFPDFDHWQEGYGAFTKSWQDRDTVIEYIRNQEAHHRTETFEDELRRLVIEAGLEWDDRYLP
jgi:REP element-mobilizing transposase RayT